METWDIATRRRAAPARGAALGRGDAVIAINLPEGDRLQEHQVHERAWVVVAAGDVEFEQGGESARGGPGFSSTSTPTSGTRCGRWRTRA